MLMRPSGRSLPTPDLEGKKSLVLKELFKGKNLILQEICQIWREIHLTKRGKICFPRTYPSTLFFKPSLSQSRSKQPHFMISNKEMPFLVVILLTGYHSLPE